MKVGDRVVFTADDNDNLWVGEPMGVRLLFGKGYGAGVDLVVGAIEGEFFWTTRFPRAHAPIAAAKVIKPGEKVAMRTFESGATRSDNTGKPDYAGFLSSLVIVRFGEYMNAHRVQADGTIRDSDNWQKGIPLDEYLSSLLRHVIDVWLLHRGLPGVYTQDIEEALCAALFNIQGDLHERLKVRAAQNLSASMPPIFTFTVKDGQMADIKKGPTEPIPDSCIPIFDRP